MALERRPPRGEPTGDHPRVHSGRAAAALARQHLLEAPPSSPASPTAVHPAPATGGPTAPCSSPRAHSADPKSATKARYTILHHEEGASTCPHLPDATSARATAARGPLVPAKDLAPPSPLFSNDLMQQLTKRLLGANPLVGHPTGESPRAHSGGAAAALARLHLLEAPPGSPALPPAAHRAPGASGGPP